MLKHFDTPLITHSRVGKSSKESAHFSEKCHQNRTRSPTGPWTKVSVSWEYSCTYLGGIIWALAQVRWCKTVVLTHCYRGRDLSSFIFPFSLLRRGVTCMQRGLPELCVHWAGWGVIKNLVTPLTGFRGFMGPKLEKNGSLNGTLNDLFFMRICHFVLCPFDHPV